MNLILKAFGAKRLKILYDAPPSKFAFIFNSCAATSRRRLATVCVDYFDGTSHYRYPERGIQDQPLWFVPPDLGSGRPAAAAAAASAAAALASESKQGVPNMRRAGAYTHPLFSST
jgi:hypothetical protein